MKITPSTLSLIHLITLSVKVSHQIFAWLAGLDALTVRIALRSSTHSFDHFSRFPLFGISQPISSFNSLNIFFRLGGKVIPSATEKLSQ